MPPQQLLINLKKSSCNLGVPHIHSNNPNIANIVIIGMTGSGKSTLARIIAKSTGRNLIDTDDEITKETLFGASTSTPGEKSPIITLRQELDVYANLRPVKSFKGVNCLFNDLDFLIVRENTEGLYSRQEEGDEEQAVAKRIITKKASERISKLAFEQAIKRNEDRKEDIEGNKY